MTPRRRLAEDRPARGRPSVIALAALAALLATVPLRGGSAPEGDTVEETPAPPEMPALPEDYRLAAAPTCEGLDARRQRACERVRDRIVCYCGGCPKLHPGQCSPGCGTEKVLLAEVRAQIEAGASEEEALDWFVGKYGQQILAAPPARGFNLVAWVGPFAALGAGCLGLLLALRRLRGTPARGPEGQSSASAPGRERALPPDLDPFR